MPRLVVLGLLALMISGCSNTRATFSLVNPLIHQQVDACGDGKPCPLVHRDLLDRDVNGHPRTYLDDKAEGFVRAYKDARNDESPDRLKRYVGAGITYTQLLCKTYFDHQVFAQSHRQYARREINLTAGLASMMLGLANASTAGVAATGTLFSFGQASFDAYDTSFVVTPELADLERLVREKLQEEERALYKKLQADKSLHWPERVETLDQAERALADYVFHCTVNGMRALLSESIQQSRRQLGNVGKEPGKP